MMIARQWRQQWSGGSGGGGSGGVAAAAAVKVGALGDNEANQVPVRTKRVLPTFYVGMYAFRPNTERVLVFQSAGNLVPIRIPAESGRNVQPSLKRLIETNIYRLAESSASTWDVLHLHTKLLDHLHYRCHHVTLVHVEDQDGVDMIRSCCDIQRQHLVHPHDHHLLVHPGSFLALVKVGCWAIARLELLFRDAAIWLPLKHEHQRE